MDKKERRVCRHWVYEGFGFPVKVPDVPMVKIRGAWTADVNYEDLERRVLEKLARTTGTLTGHQVRFIRQSFGLTLQAFAERFGVTHPAVLKWEHAGDRATQMAWTTEKDLRLFITEQQKAPPGAFFEVYQSLKERPLQGTKPETVQLDALMKVTRDLGYTPHPKEPSPRRRVRLG